MAINKTEMNAIAHEMRVQRATAEVYVLDSFAVGAPVSHEFLMAELAVTPELFRRIRQELSALGKLRLRMIKDNLENGNMNVSYNQIKLVIGCLLRDVDY